MTCSPSRGWLCRSTPCTSFPPCMRSRLQGSDFYPGGSTSHWTHQFSSGHTARLLPPERSVVNQSILGSREPTLLCHHLTPAKSIWTIMRLPGVLSASKFCFVAFQRLAWDNSQVNSGI